MRITQGTFSFLPDLTDDEIRAQIDYALGHEWPLSIEYTDDPHPRNTYWDMWGMPMFDLVDPAAVMAEVVACRDANPQTYVRVNAYDASLGRQTVALSFLVNRPSSEPGFRLDRQEGKDRQVGYTIHPYATEAPAGSRYGTGSPRDNGSGRA